MGELKLIMVLFEVEVVRLPLLYLSFFLTFEQTDLHVLNLCLHRSQEKNDEFQGGDRIIIRKL